MYALHHGVEWMWLTLTMGAWLVLVGLVAYFLVRLVLDRDRRPAPPGLRLGP
jgi:hypothetical protein